MTNIIRSLSFAIVQAIYPLIPDLYGVVMDLAKNRYFTTEAIQTLSGNIYIVISVCMLFALGIKLISAIVNPDMLTDQKKGVKSVAMHAIFAVFLIVLIPIGFDKLYEVQGDVVENQLIEKIVLGMDTSEDSEPGQILAAYAFASFCQPNENVSVEALSSSGSDLYNKAISGDISKIKEMDGVINSKTDGVYDLEYNAIISPAVGIYLIYQLILMAMDMALRTIKLGVLQLITPVILCAYVVAGTDILQRWAKMVMSTFVLLFLKIAMISFMIYGLSLLPDFLDNFSGETFWYRGFLRLFMIIGLLQLIKQIPDIINNIFGTSIKSRGGIRGRLGEMAAVGDLAQRGWDQLRQHPLQTAQRLVSAPLSAVGGGLAHSVAAVAGGIQRGRAVAKEISARKGRAAGLRGFAVGAAQSLAGIATSGGAAWRAGRQGLQNGNLRGIGEAGSRYEDTHPSDSTFGGRLADQLTTSLGIGTRQTRQEASDKYVMHNNQRMTFEELQARQSLNKAFDDGRSSVRGQIETAFDREASGIMLDDGHDGGGITYGNVTLKGNSASIREQIQALSNSTANELGLKDIKDANGNTITAAQQKADLIAGLNQQYINTKNKMLDDAENSVWANGINAGIDYTNDDGTIRHENFLVSGADKAIVNNSLNAVTDLLTNNPDMAGIVEKERSDGTKSKISVDNSTGQIRITDFRDGGRNNVSDEYNDIIRDVTKHDQNISARPTTPDGRHIKADNDAVNARNNNNGGNNGGNGH